MASLIAAGGEYPFAVVTIAHSAITDVTKADEVAAAAISPALARVKIAITATEANPNNFNHISAMMWSLIRPGTPPAAKVSSISSHASYARLSIHRKSTCLLSREARSLHHRATARRRRSTGRRERDRD